MVENETFDRVDVDRMEQIRRTERPTLHIRWWFVLPLALLLCVAQVLLDYVFEFNPTEIYPIATQLSIIEPSALLIVIVVVGAARGMGFFLPHRRGRWRGVCERHEAVGLRIDPRGMQEKWRP